MRSIFYNCALCSVGSSVCVIITRVVAEVNALPINCKH